jgi:cytochrome c556
MTRTLSLALLVCIAGGICAAAEPADESKASYWMEKKLEYNQRIMRGLSTEDFAEIGKAARSMQALSQLERWVRGGVPDYRAQLAIFQNANQELIRTAENRNLDGAALAYVQLTLSCVNCHKVVRHLERQSPPAAEK